MNQEISVPLETVTYFLENSFRQCLVLDPSCFYSLNHLKTAIGTLDRFQTREVVVPQMINQLLRERELEERFVGFITKYWNGIPRLVRKSWRLAIELPRTYPLSSPRIIREQFHDNLLMSVLKKTFPVEHEVLFDIVSGARERHAIVLAFGHSKWSLLEKLMHLRNAKKVRIKFRRIGKGIRALHKWKVKNIRPMAEALSIPLGFAASFGTLKGGLFQIDSLQGIVVVGLGLTLIE